MNELPVFIQLFVRTFALLAAGFWMQTLGGSNPEEKKEADGKPADQKMEAPANPATPARANTPPACDATRARR
jgi:hypothetical protein